MEPDDTKGPQQAVSTDVLIEQFTPDQVTEIQTMIDSAVKNALAFAAKQFGDTPTDANQLVPKKYVDSRIPYFGYVNIDGTVGTPFPTGWSSVKDSTGKYTITHNLGTTNYVVVLMMRDSDITTRDVVYCVQSIGSNTFTVWSIDANNASNFIDLGFFFILAKS